MRRTFYSYLMTGLLLASPFSAQAQEHVYTVEQVKIDIRGENPVEAREKAFEQAQVKAFSALSKSLNNGQAVALDIGTVAPLLKDFEITDEKIAADRYAATYTIRFNQAAVQSVMSRYGVVPLPPGAPGYTPEGTPPLADGTVPPADSAYPVENTASPNQPSYSNMFNGQQPVQVAAAPADDPVLLLAYWRVNGTPVLWGAGNRWADTWQRLERATTAAASFTLPIGDLADVQELGDNIPDQPEQITRLLARYQTAKAVVLVGEDSPRGITTEIYRTTPAGSLNFVKSIESPRGPSEDMYSIAAGQALAELRGGAVGQAPVYTQGNGPVAPSATDAPVKVQGPVVQMIMVESTFSNAREWMQIKTALEGAMGVARIDVVSLRPGSALIKVNMSQPVEQVIQNLRQSSLSLRQMASVPAISGIVPDYQLSLLRGGV